MINKYHKLNIFLNNYRVGVEKGKEELVTHVALPNPGKHRAGKFNIPDEKLNEFYNILTSINEPMSIAENHLPDYSPIIIDLDFRKKLNIIQDTLSPIRLYKQSDIDTFIKHLYIAISKYVDITTKKDYTIAYIMEKTPRNPDNNGLVKDGVHIIFPDLHLPYNILYLIRNDVINDKVIIDLFNNMDLDNTIDNIYDKSVIKTTAWMMYYNCKPGSTPYIITRYCSLKLFNSKSSSDFDKKIKIRLDDKDFFIGFTNITTSSEYAFDNMRTSRLNRMSIRKKIDKLRLKIEDDKLESLYQEYVKNQENKKPIGLIKRNNPTIKNSDNVLVLSKFLVENSLSPSRADQYDLWVELAGCLHSINPLLRSTFIEFSKLSYKYVDEADCDRIWNKTSKINHLDALALLIKWVKFDTDDDDNKY